jgi:signal recognition particle subunit SRP54
MVPEGAAVDEKVLTRIEAMINSMTPYERLHPEIIDDKRAKRIAGGSGRKLPEVKDLLQRFEAMREVMKRVGQQPSLLSRLPGFKEALELAKSRGEDVSDLLPGGEQQGGGMWPGLGARKMTQAEKDRRRRREKLAKKARKKMRKKK